MTAPSSLPTCPLLLLLLGWWLLVVARGPSCVSASLVSQYDRAPNRCWGAGMTVWFERLVSDKYESTSDTYMDWDATKVEYPVTTPSIQLPCKNTLPNTATLNIGFAGYGYERRANTNGFETFISVNGDFSQSFGAERWQGMAVIGEGAVLARSLQSYRDEEWAEDACFPHAPDPPAECWSCGTTTQLTCLPLDLASYERAVRGPMLPRPLIRATRPTKSCGEVELQLQWSSMDDFMHNPSRRYTMELYQGPLQLHFRTIRDVAFDADGGASVRVGGLPEGDLSQLRLILINPLTAMPSTLSAAAADVAPRSCKQASSVVGDPEFVGLLGQHYQVHGVEGEVYNIISDESVQYNARFVFLDSGACPVLDGRKQRSCWSHPGSYLGELGIKTRTGDRLHVVPGGSAVGFERVTFNGRPLRVGDSVHFADGLGGASFNTTHAVHVRVGHWALALDNSDAFVNQRVRAVVAHEQLRAHGLLGQTWRQAVYSGPVKFIAGEVDDYVIQSGDVFGDDFVFNAHPTNRAIASDAIEPPTAAEPTQHKQD